VANVASSLIQNDRGNSSTIGDDVSLGWGLWSPIHKSTPRIFCGAQAFHIFCPHFVANRHFQMQMQEMMIAAIASPIFSSAIYCEKCVEKSDKSNQL